MHNYNSSRANEIPIYFIFFEKPVDKIPILCYHNKSIYTLQEELS